MNSCSTDY